MRSGFTTRLLGAAASLVLVALLIAPGALATAPANDDLANATAVAEGDLPFSTTVDVTDSTVETGEPSCFGGSTSVWYRVTPTQDGTVEVALASGSIYDWQVAVYRESNNGLPGFGALAQVDCTVFRSPVRFDVTAGNTYWVRAGSVFSTGGTLSLTIDRLPPPANDDFANAQVVGDLPFSDTLDLAAATVEPGEPIAPSGAFTPMAKTVWYAFTPAVTRSYSLRTSTCCFTPIRAVWRGDSLDALTEVASSSSLDPLTFVGTAGQRYLLQIGGGSFFGSPTSLVATLDVAPDPSPSFYVIPVDPSTFDDAHFADQSWDPAGMGIATRHWDFGDGASSDEASPFHRYGNDGDYTVKFTVSTPDGRSAVNVYPLQMRTHDVGITRFATPAVAKAGQTKTITVSVANARYAENVNVRIERSIGGGEFQIVSQQEKPVPVLVGGRTVSFSTPYTFTAADAATGKVSFRAVVGLAAGRDAAPSDNVAISLATSVTR
jgi:hypothetical protein